MRNPSESTKLAPSTLWKQAPGLGLPRGSVAACRDGLPGVRASVASVVLRVRNKGGFVGTEQGSSGGLGVDRVGKRLARGRAATS